MKKLHCNETQTQHFWQWRCVSHFQPSQLLDNRRCRAVQCLDANQKEVEWIISVTIVVWAPSTGREQVGGHEEDEV